MEHWWNGTDRGKQKFDIFVFAFSGYDGSGKEG
jgi:hypothetical protein